MSTLYIVPTPIGNLEDITIRAKRLLDLLRIIICEDTRRTKKLLELLGIDHKKKKLISYFEPKEAEKTPYIINLLTNEDACLVSDSGTPLLSDPGYKLVHEIINFHPVIKICVLPGATSITTALIVSGQPTHKFFFLGFLPNKKGQKQNLFKKIYQLNEILKTSFIAFESPHRILKTLEFLNEDFGKNIKVSICKELTKIHEKTLTGSPDKLLELIKDNEIIIKGEFVIVFSFI